MSRLVFGKLPQVATALAGCTCALLALSPIAVACSGTQSATTQPPYGASQVPAAKLRSSNSSEGAPTNGVDLAVAKQARIAVEDARQSGYRVRLLDFSNVATAHLNQMTSLVNNAFGLDQDVEQFTDHLRWGLSPLAVVAEIRGEIIGVVTSRCNSYVAFGDEQYITNVVVAEDHRRQGLARAMLLSLLAEIEDRPIRVDTNLDNESAYRLYSALDFQEIYRETGNEGGVIMRRVGIGSPNVPLDKRDFGAVYSFVNTLVKDGVEILPGSEDIPTEAISLDQLEAEFTEENLTAN